MKLVKSYYVWIGIDKTGDESVMAMAEDTKGPATIMSYPTEQSALQAVPMLQEMVNESGMNVQLIRFESRRIIKSLQKKNNIHLHDFLTEDEIVVARSIKTAKEVKDKVILPNIERINRALGQENDPMFMAYLTQYLIGKETV